MTSEELYNIVLAQLSINEVHPLHNEMLMECCENAIENKHNVTDLNSLIMAVQVAFVSCNSALKALLSSSLEVAGAEQATLNYRGQSFVIPKTSPILT